MDDPALITDGNPNPADLTHDDYLQIIQRAKITGVEVDLATMLTEEAKKTLKGLYVATLAPEIEAKRSEVAKYDQAKDQIEKPVQPSGNK